MAGVGSGSKRMRCRKPSWWRTPTCRSRLTLIADRFRSRQVSWTFWASTRTAAWNGLTPSGIAAASEWTMASGLSGRWGLSAG